MYNMYIFLVKNIHGMTLIIMDDLTWINNYFKSHMVRVVMLMLYTKDVYLTRIFGHVKFVYNLYKCCFQREIYRRKRSLITGSRLSVTGHLGSRGELEGQ